MVKYLIVIGISMITNACAIGPDLPASNGQGIIVLGFTADEAIPHEGGTLYTGLRISKLNGQTIGPPSLAKYDYLLVDPGTYILEGYCYWQLRSVYSFEDDFQERAYLELEVKADTRYTIQSQIDNYKYQCKLSVIESAHP